MNNRKYFECQCQHPEHRLVVVTSKFEGEPSFLTFETFLSNGTFLERLWTGVKYIFGFKSKYGHFGEFILDPNNTQELIDVLEQFKKEF